MRKKLERTLRNIFPQLVAPEKESGRKMKQNTDEMGFVR
jgi:hypothetical protein